MMAESILKKKNASPEAISVALQLTHIAWNYADEDYRNEPGYIYELQEIETIIPSIKEEFVIQNCEELVEKLIEYKQRYFSSDKRTIFSCKYEKGNVKIAWK